MFGYVIAKYIRLSVDDNISESLSVSNQRKQIDDHICELNIPNRTVLEFVDNGYSGTNMNRPAFQKMLSLINSGIVKCVVIKDFSRFSRNALECGYFIENVCPMLGIRFISVTDCFDTVNSCADTGGIDVTFKYLVHEYYSKDLSKKVKSVKRNQMINGENIVANAIYGYLKNDKKKWEPDPVSADVVRQIFQMALDGKSTAQIRDKLSADKNLTPREYIKMKRGKDIKPAFMWTVRMVYRMLTNEQYTGTYIAGKQEIKAVGSHSKINNDKSKWIIIPNHHPEIISKNDYDKVQEMLLHRKGSTTAKPVISPFADESLKPRRLRMMNGERKTAIPTFGYKKAEDGSLVIDEAAATVIRDIFDMAVQTLTCAQISSKLSELGYRTPSEYIKQNKGCAINSANRWTPKSVRSILKNEQYTGAYISGKILKDYETGRMYHVPKNEWVVIPGKNPAIINREIFAEVQSIMLESRHKHKNTRPRDYLLRGKVVCGCCGYALAYDGGAENKYYRCHHSRANPKAVCHKMKVNACELDEAVWEFVKKKVIMILGSFDEYTFLKEGENPKKLCEYESLIGKAVKKLEELYLDYVSEKIGQMAFVSLKKECTKRIDTLNAQATALRKVNLNNLTLKKSVEPAKDVLNETTTPHKIVKSLVSKVHVFPNYEINIDFNAIFLPVK